MALQDNAERHLALNWSGTIAGAVVSLAVLGTLTLAGVALISEEPGLPFALLGLVVAVVLALFAGGWVLGRTLAPGSSRMLHVLSLWAGVIVVLFGIAGSQAASLLSLALTQIGLTSSAAVQLNALIEEVAELEPRLETEIKITEGKAVTHLKFGRMNKSMSREMAEASKEESRSLKPFSDDLLGAKREAERAIRRASLAGTIVSLAALGSCAAGTRFSQRKA